MELDTNSLHYFVTLVPLLKVEPYSTALMKERLRCATESQLEMTLRSCALVRLMRPLRFSTLICENLRDRLKSSLRHVSAKASHSIACSKTSGRYTINQLNAYLE